MEKEILNLNKLESKDGKLIVVHQELETPVVHKHATVELDGTISAVGNFIEKRLTGDKPQDDLKRCHVLFSYRDRFIKLITREHCPSLGTGIGAKLTINPAFVELGINCNKIFSVKELTKHIRMNRFYFESKEQHEKIVHGLQNFTAKVNADIKKINDNRGNIEDVYKTTLQSNSELSFQVLMPVFIGEPAKSIKIEISCEADNSAVKFWLESPDLIELTQKDTKTIIDNELKRVPEEIVIIEQ